MNLDLQLTEEELLALDSIGFQLGIIKENEDISKLDVLPKDLSLVLKIGGLFGKDSSRVLYMLDLEIYKSGLNGDTVRRLYYLNDDLSRLKNSRKGILHYTEVSELVKLYFKN